MESGEPRLAELCASAPHSPWHSGTQLIFSPQAESQQGDSCVPRVGTQALSQDGRIQRSAGGHPLVLCVCVYLCSAMQSIKPLYRKELCQRHSLRAPGMQHKAVRAPPSYRP